MTALAKNWAGNFTYHAATVVSPSTVAEAQEAVRAAKKLRVLGSRHCFNDIADTDGTHLSLARMNSVVALDRAKREVVIEGGVRYGELGPWLHGEGYALHNLASLPHISVAGACATATHGSGMSLGGLATAVKAIEFIDGRGELVTLVKGRDETFAGAVVNLGALGAVTRMTLAIEPAFDARQDVFMDLPLPEAEAHFEEIMSAGYSVSWFTDWQGEVIEQVWIKSKLGGDTSFAARTDVFGAKPATRNMHPLAKLDAVHCTDQLGVTGPSYERLPHFRMGFTPASGDEIQVEYFVPRENAVAIVRTLHNERARLAPLLLISEVRTVAADDLWMSPYYRRPTVAFHFSFKSDEAALRRMLPGLEAALAPFHPLPHWGKVFTLAPSVVQAGYPRLYDFRDLVTQHDPEGKFRNGYIDEYVFGT